MLNPLYSQRLKGVIDVFFAIVGLIVTLPLFLIIAIILKIQKEDVFFFQDRVGQNQRKFKIIKFTTMKKDSEKQGLITTVNDPRITPLGRFLRKSKINEIPQLFNILKGEMSFVGPRPLPIATVEGYYSLEEKQKIYSVKPGLTGYGSLEFSDEEQLIDKDDAGKSYREVIVPKKTKLEIWYVDNFNIILDLSLIFRTIFKLLFGFLSKRHPK